MPQNLKWWEVIIQAMVWCHYDVDPDLCCLILSLSHNSLAPAKFEWHFRYLIFLIISVIVGCISCEIALTWMPQVLTDKKSSLAQVMAWCQCWPTSLSPYGIIRPQWVKTQTGHLLSFQYLGTVSMNRCCLTRAGIPITKIRQSYDSLIFKTGMPTPGP